KNSMGMAYGERSRGLPVTTRSLRVVTGRTPPTLAPFVVPNLGCLRVGVWTEVAQRYQRVPAGVLEHDALPGAVVACGNLVLRQLPVADHRRRLQGKFADPAAALHRNQAICPIVLDGHLDPRINRQLLGCE